MAMKVEVVAPSARWPEEFRREAARIAAALGDQLVEIHHIGSTAVPGLAAKPIIDILPVVRDIEAVDAKNPAFEALGYECMGEVGIPGRRYFRRGGDRRTHQVHVFGQASQADILRHLAVRDYLRAHVDAAAAYARLKIALAAQFPFDIEAYCDGKDAFVRQLERDALAWYRGQGGRAAGPGC